MPAEIYLSKADTKETQIIKADELQEGDVIIKEKAYNIMGKLI